ncbi:MAG: hypothetical protein V1896_01590 [Candidatus Zambryskibacteria bacterium]
MSLEDLYRIRVRQVKDKKYAEKLAKKHLGKKKDGIISPEEKKELRRAERALHLASAEQKCREANEDICPVD